MLEDMKCCSKCGEPQPLGTFYRDKKSSDGHCCQCKTCMYASQLRWASSNKEKVRAANLACQRRKAVRLRAAKPPKEKVVPWELRNPEKMLKYKTKWREANRKAANESSRKAKARTRSIQKAAKLEALEASRPANYGLVKVCTSCEQELVLDGFRNRKGGQFEVHSVCKECEHEAWANRSDESRENHRQHNRQYRAENLEEVRARMTIHCAKRRGWASGESYTLAEWRTLVAQHDNRCLRCNIKGTDTKEGKLTQDHVVPLSRGGGNTIANIQPLCWPCNHWKATKTIDFRPQKAAAA